MDNNQFEELLLSNLEANYQAGSTDTKKPYDLFHFTASAVTAYKDLMEARRSRIDADVMQYSFEQGKLAQERAEKVAKAVMGKTSGPAQ